MRKAHLVIGTRGSPLALWQARYVRQLLHPLERIGIHTHLEIIQTHGDIGDIGDIGTTPGAFTNAIDQALMDNKIDLGVHSAKDVPSVIDPEIDIIAYTQRSRPHDVLIAYHPEHTHAHVQLPQGYRIGTSSARRQAQMAQLLPQCTPVPIRGNIETRLEKLHQGHCDALILAYAGVQRLGYEKHIVQHLDVKDFTPTAGQGSLIVVGSKRLKQWGQPLIEQLRHALQHEQSALCVIAERAFLRSMGLGCQNPVFGLASFTNNLLSLCAGLYHQGHRWEHKEALRIQSKTSFTLNADANEQREGIPTGLHKQLQQLGERVAVHIQQCIESNI